MTGIYEGRLDTETIISNDHKNLSSKSRIKLSQIAMVDLIILKKIQNRSVRNLAFIIRADGTKQLSLPVVHKLRGPCGSQ